MDITPDTKDWTWVLRRPCPECRYTAADVPILEIAGRVRSNAVAWGQVLSRSSGRRPSPGVWSPLEYACHVRDVLRLYDSRLVLMLTTDDPLYPSWDQDESALAQRYGEQDPAVVAVELMAAAVVIADRIDGVTDWSRPGRRSDGAQFTVESFARYFLHDVVHHLHDVGAPTSP